jgi:hypothetical protein
MILSTIKLPDSNNSWIKKKSKHIQYNELTVKQNHVYGLVLIRPNLIPSSIQNCKAHSNLMHSHICKVDTYKVTVITLLLKRDMKIFERFSSDQHEYKVDNHIFTFLLA